ncbi:MAG: cytochrome c3 family protein [Chloroflexota bacterium]
MIKMKKMLLLVAGFVILGGLFYFLNADRVLALDQTGCLACHGNENFTKPGANGQPISLYVSETAVNSGAHRYIDCTTCHTTDPHAVDTPLNKLSLAEKCGTCHQYQYELHLESVHGQQLLQGNQDVATCVDCHSPTSNPHSVIRVLEYNAPAYKKNIA